LKSCAERFSMRNAVYTAEDDKQYTEQEIKKIITDYINFEFVNVTEEQAQNALEKAYIQLITKHQRQYPCIEVRKIIK
jgi:hypothetical protein